MKNSSLSMIAVFVGSTFLLATTGCDADNSSDSLHDEEQSEALDMDGDDPHSATPDTQQPSDARKVTVEADADAE